MAHDEHVRACILCGREYRTHFLDARTERRHLDAVVISRRQAQVQQENVRACLCQAQGLFGIITEGSREKIHTARCLHKLNLLGKAKTAGLQVLGHGGPHHPHPGAVLDTREPPAF